MGIPSCPGGFTSSDPDRSDLPSPSSSDSPPADSIPHSRPIRNRQQPDWPIRNRQQPDRYGIYIEH